MKLFFVFLLLIALLQLTSCAQVAQQLPTLSYCDEVKYSRTGHQIEIMAKCNTP